MLTCKIVVVYCVLILCAKVVISKGREKKPLKDNDAEVKHTFAKLLNTIITVNEGRMQTMKKMARLQDYMLTKNKLKTDDADGFMEEDDNRILFAFADMPQLRRTEDETITRSDRFNLEKNNGHFVDGSVFEDGLSEPRHRAS